MTNAPLITIYNENELRMDRDDECVILHNCGIQVLEMTRVEFEALVKAYEEAE